MIFAVILPAAGTSSRFGSNKLLERIGGRRVIDHSIDAFLFRDDVSQVIVATNDANLVDRSEPKLSVCPGGSCRAETVKRAVDAVKPGVDWVAIHDAARPLVSRNLIDRVFKAALEHNAAGPATAVTLTIKQAAGPLPARVERTVPRQTLWAMQTPQAMRKALLEKAFATTTMNLAEVTDDLQLLESVGIESWLVEGEESNLKLTRAADLAIAAAFGARQSQ